MPSAGALSCRRMWRRSLASTRGARHCLLPWGFYRGRRPRSAREPEFIKGERRGRSGTPVPQPRRCVLEAAPGRESSRFCALSRASLSLKSRSRSGIRRSSASLLSESGSFPMAKSTLALPLFASWMARTIWCTASDAARLQVPHTWYQLLPHGRGRPSAWSPSAAHVPVRSRDLLPRRSAGLRDACRGRRRWLDQLQLPRRQHQLRWRHLLLAVAGSTSTSTTSAPAAVATPAASIPTCCGSSSPGSPHARRRER